MSDPIVELVQGELERFQDVREQSPTLFPDQPNLYPIPFFGDIRRAEVVTLALNPSCTEFVDGRNWLPNVHPPSTTAPSLATRLVHYFDLPAPGPHRWFDECEKALLYLGCSYEANAVHLDLHPLPTKFLRALSAEGRQAFGNLVSHAPSHLKAVLSLCPLAKLIVVVDYQFPAPGGGLTTTFDFIAEAVDGLSRHIAAAGAVPPVFRAGTYQDLADRVYQHRLSLRAYLRQAVPCPFTA